MTPQPPPLANVVKTSGLAVASLVLGILSITCLGFLTGIPAIILGLIASNRIGKPTNQLRGQGLAIAGVATGGVGLIVGTAMLAAMLLPALASARASAQRSACANQMKSIGVAIAQYYEDHNQQMPRSLDDLKQYVDGNDRIFICPAAQDRATPTYVLLPDEKFGGSRVRMLLTEPQGIHRHGRNVLYNDGHVEWQPLGAADSD